MNKGARTLKAMIIVICVIFCGVLAAHAGQPTPGYLKPKPDLAANIKITVRSSYQVHNQGSCKGLAVICTITNKGKSDAKNVGWKLEARAQKKGPHSNPHWKLLSRSLSPKTILKPGQHYTMGYLTDKTHEFDWCDFYYGKVAFRFTVDYENKVSEQDENNNTATATFPVKPFVLNKGGAVPALKQVKPK